MKPLQDTFNTVLFALRKQGKASVNLLGSCQYRGADGCKCAIGHLIPDELYKVSMEGKSTYDALVFRPLVALGLLPEAIKFSADLNASDGFRLLSRLQTAHDAYLKHGMARWEAQMVKIANEFNLEYTP